MKTISIHSLSSKFVCCISTSVFYSTRCNNKKHSLTFHSFNDLPFTKSVKEKALDYVSQSTRLRIQDLRDNPGARTMVFEIIYFKIYLFNLATSSYNCT